MATHPYISGVGNLARMVGQLRKSFPATVTSETVKKLGLAPNNESYGISALQFLGPIDSEGKKTDEASKIFPKHKDDDFSKAFEGVVKKAYVELFELHADGAWELSIIGRNLNQLVRLANAKGELVLPGRHDLTLFIKVCTALRDHFKSALKANKASWEVGYAPRTRSARSFLAGPCLLGVRDREPYSKT